MASVGLGFKSQSLLALRFLGDKSDLTLSLCDCSEDSINQKSSPNACTEYRHRQAPPSLAFLLRSPPETLSSPSR